MIPARHSCQVVVVGTGAGGAVAAATLAKAGVDTIMVEQGRSWTADDHKDVIGGFSRLYLNGGITATLGNPPIVIPQGIAVGGTTVINSSTCFRPPRDKVEAWGGGLWDDLVPCFEEVERRINVHTVDEELLGGNGRIMKRGCDALGIDVRPLAHNVKECKGRGRCQYGCPQAAKQSMELTFVPDAKAAGARLLEAHCVDNVLVRNDKAAGVTGQAPNGRFEIRAETVVLAMGTLSTAGFLKRRGLANSSGRVGHGLTIHPAARVVAEMDEIVDGFIGLPQGAYIDRWADRGVMLEGIFMPPGLLLSSIPGAGHEFKQLAAAYRRLAAFGVMVEDTGAGSVGRGYLGNPFTAFYSLNQADAESMRFGMARLAEIYFAAGAKRVITNLLPMPVLNSQDDLRTFETMPVAPSHVESMAFHPLGTCGMGGDPRASVVNFDLETHDLNNLYVMDGSAVPSSLGVNPQITIMCMAMRAAKRLARKYAASAGSGT